jgi:putative membrane protein
MSRINLKEKDLHTIRKSVSRAEASTSGEIATAVVPESSDYGTYELIFSIVGGFVYFFVALFFSDRLEVSLQSLSWVYSPRHLLLFYGVSTLLVIVLLYLLANTRFVDRLIVPRPVMARRVQERARRHFTEVGVFNTRDRTGILLFISELEQRVELLADRGISAKIDQQQWDEIIKNLIEGIKSGEPVPAICRAVEECGKLLAEYFPRKVDDRNELDDSLSVLEK